MRLRLFWRRWGVHRVHAARLSEYHDEGMPLYELESCWEWRGRTWARKSKVLT